MTDYVFTAVFRSADNKKALVYLYGGRDRIIRRAFFSPCVRDIFGEGVKEVVELTVIDPVAPHLDADGFQLRGYDPAEGGVMIRVEHELDTARLCVNGEQYFFLSDQSLEPGVLPPGLPYTLLG